MVYKHKYLILIFLIHTLYNVFCASQDSKPVTRNSKVKSSKAGIIVVTIICGLAGITAIVLLTRSYLRYRRNKRYMLTIQNQQSNKNQMEISSNKVSNNIKNPSPNYSNKKEINPFQIYPIQDDFSMKEQQVIDKTKELQPRPIAIVQSFRQFPSQSTYNLNISQDQSSITYPQPIIQSSPPQ